MKTVLINTQMVSILGFNTFGTGNFQSNWIQHGLGLISSFAKKAGFDIQLIDLRKCKSWKDFSHQIENLEPDVAGLSMTSLDYNPVIKSLKILKGINKNITTVIGGIHPSVCLEDVEDNPTIDHIVQGEGEISFTELLKALESGTEQPRIISGVKADLDTLPFVDREIFDYKHGELSHPFRSLDIFEPPFVTMISSRGCTYNCKFCQPAERILFGRKVRRRSVDNFVEELHELRRKYHFKSLFVHDDCFTENEEWVLNFCNRYQEEGFNQPFYAQCRADIVCKKESMIKRLADVGLCYLSIGFESGSQRILDFLRKGVTVEQNLLAAEICRKYDIKIGGNFMLGIPTETKEEVLLTIELIKAIKPYSTGISHFTPFPGSDLYTYCVKNNLFKVTNYDVFHNGRNSKSKIKGVNYRFLKKVENDLLEVPFVYRILYFSFLKKVFASKLLSNVNQYFNRFYRYKKIKTWLARFN